MNLKRQEAAYLLLLKSVILMKSLLSVGDLDIAVAPLAVARLLRFLSHCFKKKSVREFILFL